MNGIFTSRTRLLQNISFCFPWKKDIITFTFMHLADAFIQIDLQCIQAIHVLSACVPWESNPQPFALLTQCSNHSATGTQDIIHVWISMMT